MRTGLGTAYLFGAGLSLILSSCAVTNNLYLNDAIPFEKGNGRAHAGLGSGFAPKIDSVSDAGAVYYSNKLNIMPNFCVGAQGHLAKGLSGRLSLNFPFVLGGIGFRGGLQYSFLPPASKFNIGIGTDLGFVLSRDSIRIFNSFFALSPEVAGMTNADLFLPITFQFSDDTRLTLTPRISNQHFWIKRYIGNEGSYSYSPPMIGISSHVKIKQTSLELTVFKIDGLLMPGLGMAKSWNF